MKKKKSKPKRRRRKKPVPPPADGSAVSQNDADQEPMTFRDYAILGGVFGTIAALVIACDMYDAVGFLGSLILFPFAVVLFGIMSFVAVYLRAVVSVLLAPAMLLLFIGALVHTIIWGPSNPDSEPSPAAEVAVDHSAE